MREAVIVSYARTAVGKAKKGSLKDTQPVAFGAAVLKAVVERTPGLTPSMVDDVMVGCAMPEGEQGLNMGRLIALRAGFPVEVPATTGNRFCSSGSQTIAWAADVIRSGNADIIIAGGVESMSMVPMSGYKPVAEPGLLAAMPAAYDAMGATAERVARDFGVSREDQDAFALRSHQRAAAAEEAGFRPCRRCRPETAPGTPAWQGSPSTVSRALRLIDDGALDDEGHGVENLAERLGVGGRHLRRLFAEQLGASPLAVAQTRRAHLARRLIEVSSLPMTRIALAAGFPNVRRFNASIRERFQCSPSEIRRGARRAAGRELQLRLAFRPPLDWSALLAYLAPRAIPGVERVDGDSYSRTVAQGDFAGVVRVSLAPGGGALVLSAPARSVA